MFHKKGDKVYVNYSDGIMEVKILDVYSNNYKIQVGGRTFFMREHQVSSEPKIIKGVSTIRRASCGAEE